MTAPHTIRITNDDGLERSRLTVFFRYLLALPHFLWLELWAVAVLVAALVAWFAALFTGRVPDPLHRFMAAFLRYSVHVNAFLWLIANPFPGFAGQEGSYPVDLHIAPPAVQNRWKSLFRIFLVLPAAMVSGVLGYVVFVVGLLGWFAALATGRMPAGMQRLGVYALRYQAQVQGYLLLLTDRYPYSGPESEWSAPDDATPPPASALNAPHELRTPAAPPVFRDPPGEQPATG